MPKELYTNEVLEPKAGDLTPQSRMPFGKYFISQTRMTDVPVEYLHWFWSEGGGCRAPKINEPVGRYIRANGRNLQNRNRDLIWVYGEGRK